MQSNRIYSMAFAKVYPLYIAKVERKGRTKSEVDEVIFWLTGYDAAALDQILVSGASFDHFFANAPALNPLRHEVTGTICGIRIEQIGEDLMRDIRIMDKLIDELAKGRPMAKVPRSPQT